MSHRYDSHLAGTGHPPTDAAGRHQDAPTLAPGRPAAHTPHNKPFSTSPGTPFPPPVVPKKTCFVSPDGRSRSWSTVGRDKSGPQHPFMKRTFQFTSPEGITTIKTVETHWTITPSKDGKSRNVRYETTQDDRMFDRSGRALGPHRKQSHQGFFADEGQRLPFELPLLDPWPRDGHSRDDAQARAHDHRRHAPAKK
jgi:hypothetical protein